MFKIICSSDVKKLLRFGLRNNISCSFIILDNKDGKHERYSDYLRHNGMKEIKIEDMSDEEKATSEKEYINGVADLGNLYDSVRWWANAVSEKNEHIASHYKNLCLYYCLIKTLKKNMSTTSCIFIVCDDEMAKQLKVYCIENNISIVSVQPALMTRVYKAVKEFYLLFSIVFFLLKMVNRKLRIPKTLKLRIKRAIDTGKDYYTIRTWLDDRFLKTNGVRSDSYFGRLPGHVGDSGYKLFMLAAIINNYSGVIRKIEESQDAIIAPEEYFFKYTDFFRLFFTLFSRRKRIKREVLFNGLNVAVLYETEIANDRFSATTMANMFRYFVAKRFAEAVSFGIFIQTFENQAWEKVTILGIRKKRPEAKIYGFQHAFISRNSFKYFVGQKEKDIIPLPDRIITMGKRTKEIMEKYGNYKEDIFRIGCALRQEYINTLSLYQRRRFNRIIVPLTMVQYESILILNFLYASGLHDNIEFIIRCHPAVSFKTLKQHINFKLPDNFIITNNKSIEEELSKADMVLYTWTTVAVEALRLGLPVIYLDILNPMYVDPLFECTALKNSVKRPEELLPAIYDFYNMDDDNFYMKQQIAQEYLRGYFYPVTGENLVPFLVN